jgi:hypothetical protein
LLACLGVIDGALNGALGPRDRVRLLLERRL